MIKYDKEETKSIFITDKKIEKEKIKEYLQNEENSKKRDFTIETTDTKECNEDSTPNLYLKMQDRNIYTFCLDEIKIKEKGKSGISLKIHIDENKNIIEDILKHLEKKDTLKDGGTTIFEDDEKDKFTNSGITIIKCNKIVSSKKYNQDIYIGPKDMEYNENFCED